MGNKKELRNKRAGLLLPPAFVKKVMRKRLPKRGIQKNVDIYATAVIEHFLKKWLVASAEYIKKGNYINATHLQKSINNESHHLTGCFSKNVPGLY